ncbi:polyphosphate polymerase domain-containing protein [Microbacterium sp.]|uniref:polyphosphate polymerase domain-containing protein n=1 Tax=Microbacterium sp. TaxID=51671 RepID=UPI0039E355DA
MIARLEPISLDELLDQAALLTRVDRKYAMTVADALEVLAELPETTRVLTMDDRRAFSYESYYFDTPDLLSFRMAALGRRRRFKLRTRSYVDTEDAFLELKTRGARSATVKERIEYGFDDREELTDEGREYAAEGLSALGIPAPDELELRPTLATRYRRTTLLAPDGGGRATIDTGLSWELADGTTMTLSDLVIIETKSGQRTGDLDRLLWRHGIRPSTISKYGTGLAALRPDLPRNKWARVLRRSFHHTAIAA